MRRREDPGGTPAPENNVSQRPREREVVLNAPRPPRSTRLRYPRTPRSHHATGARQNEASTAPCPCIPPTSSRAPSGGRATGSESEHAFRESTSSPARRVSHAQGERRETTYRSCADSDDGESCFPAVPLDDVEEAVEEALARVLRKEVEFVEDDDDGLLGDEIGRAHV